MLETTQLITPEAEEFRDALFELAQLYYRTGRYEEAVGRLEELTERYPQEERMGQLLFLMADSYRKSAATAEGRERRASRRRPRRRPRRPSRPGRAPPAWPVRPRPPPPSASGSTRPASFTTRRSSDFAPIRPREIWTSCI